MVVELGVKATRADLLRAAAIEISERGYSGAALSSTAARLGLTKGAFAYHFKTKSDIAAALMEGFQSACSDAVKQAREEFPEDDLYTLLMAICSIESEARTNPIVAAAFTLMTDPSPPVEQICVKFTWWARTIETFLDNAREQGQIQVPFSPARVAEFLTASLLTFVNLCDRTSTATDAPEHSHLQLLLSAIGVKDPKTVLAAAASRLQTEDRRPRVQRVLFKVPEEARTKIGARVPLTEFSDNLDGYLEVAQQCPIEIAAPDGERRAVLVSADYFQRLNGTS